jgi:ribulose-5-phosphate 4-epimerase/fuculose-1-phosphate aldolase
MFYDDIAVYQGFGGIALAKEEGRHIAAALGPRKRNIILRNHSILTAGGTISEAAAFFLALERAC